VAGAGLRDGAEIPGSAGSIRRAVERPSLPCHRRLRIGNGSAVPSGTKSEAEPIIGGLTLST
jgi:hypothetical protein